MRQREANLGPYRARPECPYLYARPDGHQISSSRAYRRTSRHISGRLLPSVTRTGVAVSRLVPPWRAPRCQREHGGGAQRMGEPATGVRCECRAASICEREPVCRNRVASLTCVNVAIAISLAWPLPGWFTARWPRRPFRAGLGYLCRVAGRGGTSPTAR